MKNDLKKLIALIVTMVVVAIACWKSDAQSLTKEAKQKLLDRKTEIAQEIKPYEQFIYHFEKGTLKPEWYKKYSATKQNEIYYNALSARDKLLDEKSEIDLRLEDFRTLAKLQSETRVEQARQKREEARREHVAKTVQKIRENPMGWRVNEIPVLLGDPTVGKAFFRSTTDGESVGLYRSYGDIMVFYNID